MGYKDNLNYDVVVVSRNGESKFECIASFDSYLFAMQFMKSELDGLVNYAFDSKFNEKGVIVELYYSTQSRSNYTLFRHPSIDLPRMKDLQEGTTKEKLAQRLSLGRSFDYALPHEWVKFVVGTLEDAGYDDKKSLHQQLTFGTVWFYPSEGVGRVSGRPVALTKDAEELLVEYIKVKGGD